MGDSLTLYIELWADVTLSENYIDPTHLITWQ